MAIQHGVSRQFIDLMVEAVSGLSYKIALYNENADLDRQTPNLASNEASGAGYTAGGKSISVTFAANATAQGEYAAGDFITVDFADVSWTGLTASFRAAAIYDTTNSKVLAVIDFGRTYSLINQTLTISWPPTNPPLGSPVVILSNIA